MTITFVGDIMLSENQIKNGYENKKSNPFEWFSCVSSYINNSDYIIGNFETIINDKKPLSGYPKFNAPEKYLDDILSTIHFTHLSLANNHCLDCGEYGLKNTFNIINKKSVKCIGVYENIPSIQIIKKDNISIGLLNYCEKINCNIELKNINVNIFDNNNIITDINQLKGKCDYILLYMHYGKEYSDAPDNKTKEILRSLIKLGVDHIICSHTHIPQEIENYTYDGKNHYIIYSLGNFISDQRRLFIDSGLVITFNINKYYTNIITEKTWVSCPDFNDLNSYRILFQNNILNENMHSLSVKEQYKLNCL